MCRSNYVEKYCSKFQVKQVSPVLLYNTVQYCTVYEYYEFFEPNIILLKFGYQYCVSISGAKVRAV
jgi:hypothetical protein